MGKDSSFPKGGALIGREWLVPLRAKATITDGPTFSYTNRKSNAFRPKFLIKITKRSPTCNKKKVDVRSR
jgi:hypothetical protein